jgi:Kef-type K+ transport system membrane component KefB
MHDTVSPVFLLLLQLLVVIAVARCAGVLFTKIGQTAVIGEMAAGILLGPSFLGRLFPSVEAVLFPPSSLQLLQLLSQLGVILFMFTVGMEFDVLRLRERARAAVVISNAGIAVPFALGIVLSLYLRADYAPAQVPQIVFALFTAVAMSVTAFPVLARIIAERGLTGTDLGNTAIACAAIADVTAWCLLTVVVAVARGQGLGGPAITIALAILFSLLVLKVIGPRAGEIFGRTVSGPSVFDRSGGPERPPATTLAWAVCFAFGSALVTEAIGIHALFGAFIAGVALSPARELTAAVRGAIEPLAAVVLLPLFFAASGLRTEIGLLDSAGDWAVCGLVIAVAVAGKLGGSSLAARWSGMGWRDSLAIGSLMNTRGLMELVVLNIGYELGILSPALYTMMVAMALATTCMAGPMLTLVQGRKHESLITSA